MIFPKGNDRPQEEGQRGQILLDGMQTSISDLDARWNAETDESIRKTIESQRTILQRALNLRNAPIESRESLSDAIDTINYDQFILNRIDDEAFDQVDLRYMMDSDLMPFFDDASQGRLAITFEQMNTSDFVQSTLRTPLIHTESVASGARKLVGFNSVMSAATPDVIYKIKMTITEAQYIRIERILEYLGSRFNVLQQLISDSSKKNIFSNETLDELGEEMGEAKRLLFDQKGNDPKILSHLGENIETAIKTFEVCEAEVETVKEKRPQIEAEVKSGYSKLQGMVENLNPDLIQQVIEQYQAGAKDHLFPDNSAIVRKAVLYLRQLKDPESELHLNLAEFTTRLETIEDISNEELVLAREDLESLQSTIDQLTNLEQNLAEAEQPENEIAQSAHETIRYLSYCKSPEEIKDVLLRNLGKSHVRFVTHSEFEKKYREFTETGSMVFDEDAEGWRIILDESSLQSGANVLELKKQLTHELLHLEFERGKGVKEAVRKEMIEGHPQEWAEIKSAFLEMAKGTNKTPPDGEQWTDDDILSELYAMQNEIGQYIQKGKGSTIKLNNLLAGAGLGVAIGDIAEKTRAFNENAKPKTRGYQGGSTESGEEPSTSNTFVGTVAKEQAVYEKNKQEIDAIRVRIKELKKSNYLQYTKGGRELLSAMESYNEGTDELNNELEKRSSELIMTTVNERSKYISTELNKVEAEVGKAARKAPNNEIGMFRKMWINTNFMSLSDFGQMGVDVFEFLERRHKRKKADHAARLGMAFFNGTDLGREAYARSQKAEADEVQEWKSRYENLDAWQLLDELANIAKTLDPSKDQLKAIVRILAQKGRINWQDPNLWICLNRLQSSVELVPGDRVVLHNPVLMRQKLHKAMGVIWDFDEYTSLLRQNESSYKSEKSKYDSEHNRSQDTLTEKMNDLMSLFEKGEKVDPIEYESIIEYCIKNGKSYAENVMFMLIVGMAKGLLPPDRGLALGEYLNNWPSIDWFTSLKPPYTKEDFEQLCKNEFKDSYENLNLSDGGGRDFKNWFWRVVQNTDRVIERVQKSVGERVWDHDWSRSIACLGSAQTAKQFLSGRSGQQETKHTAIGNAYVGAVQWLEENSLKPEFASKKHFAKIAAWIAMSEGVLNGTAYNRKDADINTRQDEAMNTSTPREAGVGRHGTASLRAHRGITQNFLEYVDAGFFGELKGKEARSEDKKKELGQWAAQYLSAKYPALAGEMETVESIDQIYDRLDLITQVMFEQMPDEHFRVMLLEMARNAQ